MAFSLRLNLRGEIGATSKALDSGCGPQRTQEMLWPTPSYGSSLEENAM